jgi:hypothetical protein
MKCVGEETVISMDVWGSQWSDEQSALQFIRLNLPSVGCSEVVHAYR